MKKEKNNNQSINCNVENCKYNDCDNEKCNLDEINVSCDCDDNEATKKETICDSFKEEDSE